MATAVQISLVQYLNTSYRPDCEYIDGEVVERNVGKWDHGRVQALLAIWFGEHEEDWDVQVSTEQRTQVGRTRIRIPDVVLVGPGEQPPVLTEAPLLVVEILSQDDTYSDTQRRADDYLKMGVRTIWIIDPATRTARVCDGDGWILRTRLEVPETEIFIELSWLFGRLDRMNPRKH